MINDEAGVLPDSKIHIFDPSPAAVQSLIHIPFWGRYHCTRPYQIDREWYDSLLLFSIRSGQLELVYEGSSQLLVPGSVRIIDCRRPQRYRALGDIHFDWIHFKGGSSQALYDHLLERSATGFMTGEQPEPAQALASLLQQLDPLSGNEWTINLALTQVLTGMADRPAAQLDWEHALVAQAHAHMTEHYREDLPLEAIARQINVSACHFARLFRRQYKVSPHEYLIGLRIGEARRRLLLTQESVERIASQCGFNSTSHFIRSFGQRTGVTPAQYRKLKF